MRFTSISRFSFVGCGPHECRIYRCAYRERACLEVAAVCWRSVAMPTDGDKTVHDAIARLPCTTRPAYLPVHHRLQGSQPIYASHSGQLSRSHQLLKFLVFFLFKMLFALLLKLVREESIGKKRCQRSKGTLLSIRSLSCHERPRRPYSRTAKPLFGRRPDGCGECVSQGNQRPAFGALAC